MKANIVIALAACFSALIFGPVIYSAMTDTSARPRQTTTRSEQASTPKLTDEERKLVTQWEREGYLLIEAPMHRAYVAPFLWDNIDAKRKETLVRVLAIDGAEKRGHDLKNIELLDKQTGKQIASFSVWSGIKLY